MAKYLILERAFINNRLYEPGESVDVADEVIPGPHMKPVDAAAKKVAKSIGLVNEDMPDFVDQMTPNTVDVTSYGASPQIGQSGMTLGEAAHS